MGRAERHHHLARSPGAQPLGGCLLPVARRGINCWPSAPSWMPCGGPAATCMSVCALCSSCMPFTVSTCPTSQACRTRGFIPFDGYNYLLRRRFEEAIDVFLKAQAAQGPNESISSALAEAYHRLGFQTLADQVRRSVRSVRGNQWMFRIGHPADQPLRMRPELLQRPAGDAPFPILRETTPVRMDLSHSAWSDIFFLGMDYPEGARVLNISIDLGVCGRDRRAAAAGGSLSARHRRAGAAPGQRRPGRQGRDHSAG